MSSPLWNPKYRLALASKSATRRKLLTDAGIPFDTVEADIDERAAEARARRAGRPTHELARALAEAKALAGSRVAPGVLCLGADQVLLLDDEILHKSGDLSEAREKLERMAGRTHRLMSGFAIARDGALVHAADDAADLTMRALSREAIDLYLNAAGEAALTSVGGYQLEKLGVHLFERISGDHTTILGLPMLKLLAWIRGQGMLRM